MLSTTNNRNIVLIFFLIISGGLTIPLLVVQVVGFPSHQTALQGVPVLDSVFADMVESEPDTVMFPAYPIVETEASITMKSDYDDLLQVDESSAVSTALDFVSRIWYLSDKNVSYDNTGGLDDGSWHLRFLGEDLRINVDVNAISGKVNYFSSVWSIGHSPFYLNQTESHFASTTSLEDLVYDFLDQFNYTLSPFAQYVSPTFVYDYILHHDVFKISFYNFVNGALIEHNGFHLFADVEASAILRFSYHWIHIDTIPTEDIIQPERAEQSALEYLEGPMNLTNNEIQATALVFERMGTVSGYEYRLGWIVIVNSDFVASIHIDAKSETRYNMGFYSAFDFESPSAPFSPNVLKLSSIQSMLVFIISAIVALVASTIVKHRTSFCLGRKKSYECISIKQKK